MALHNSIWSKREGHWDLVCAEDDTLGDHICCTNLGAVPWPPPAPEDGDHWGPWVYRPATNVLAYEPHGRWEYEVDLDRCRTRAETMNWVVHLNDKTWLTEADLGH